MELIIFAISILVFFYVLHYFVHDDFIILRRNTSAEQVFNMIFLSFIPVFIVSRFLFIVQNQNSLYLNPLVFLAFPYYPGFSLTGGLLGGALFSAWYIRRRKLPGKRIFDFISLSLVWSIPIYGFLSIVIFRKFLPASIVEVVMFTLLLVIFSVFLIPKYMAGKIKDGFITGVFCMGYSAILILVSFLEGLEISAMVLEDGLLIAIFIAGLSLILREQLMPKIRDLQ